MLKTIFFDIGNVLVFFDLVKMQEQIAQCTGLSCAEVQQILLNEKVFFQYECGQINTQKFYDIFQKYSRKKFTLNDLLRATADIFRPNTNLWPTVSHLKERGLRLIFLSNTSECHFQHLSRIYPVFQVFDDRILSYEVGALKPDPKIFHAALSIAKCDPKECFYTDDIPEFILSAQKCGLDSEVFTTVENLKKA
ncbi:MAG: HAD-IA family hydrolase, partial [Chlamydiae bacterium]|nr:HAD-IA family hydrolase [Chlamydiota bacterium]